MARWKRTTETLPSGRRITVHRSGPLRVWKDDDVDHGPFACSIEHRGQETILGHAATEVGAKRLASRGASDVG